MREQREPPPVPGWLLIAALVCGAAGALCVAALGWVGVAVIAAGVAGACVVLLRWSRWPRTDRGPR